jgi:hypothetical protein
VAGLRTDLFTPAVRTVAGVAADAARGGLADLALKGTRAATGARAFGTAGAVGAGVTAATGMLADVPALVRGELDVRGFSENRVLDVVEGGAGAVAGIVALEVAGGVAATASMPAVAGAAAALGTGLVVSAGFRRVREVVGIRQQDRLTREAR